MRLRQAVWNRQRLQIDPNGWGTFSQEPSALEAASGTLTSVVPTFLISWVVVLAMSRSSPLNDRLPETFTWTLVGCPSFSQIFTEPFAFFASGGVWPPGRPRPKVGRSQPGYAETLTDSARSLVRASPVGSSMTLG